MQPQAVVAQFQRSVLHIHPARHGLICRRVHVEQHPLLVRGIAIGRQQPGQQLVAAQCPAEGQPINVRRAGVGGLRHLGVERSHRVGQADRADDAVGLVRGKLIDVAHHAARRVDVRLGQVGTAAGRVFGGVDDIAPRRAHHACSRRGKQGARLGPQRGIVQKQPAVKHRDQILRCAGVAGIAAPQQHGLVQAAAVAVENIAHRVRDEVVALHHLYFPGVHIRQFQAGVAVQFHSKITFLSVSCSGISSSSNCSVPSQGSSLAMPWPVTVALML